MAEEAIQKDVSAREQMVNNIVADQREVREPEEEILDETILDDEEEIIEDELDEVTLKVNGEEITVDRDKVYDAGVRTLQKETAADQKLEEVTARENSLNDRESELRELEAEILAKRDAPEAGELGREFASAIFDDEDKVAALITKLDERINTVESQQTVAGKRWEDQDKVAEQTEATEQAKVVSHYHEKYDDIANNTDMHNALNRRLGMIAEENSGFSTTEVIDEAARQVYEKFSIDKSTTRKAKENMPSRPKKASGKKPVIPKEKPKQRSDVLAEMRKGRGVQAY